MVHSEKVQGENAVPQSLWAESPPALGDICGLIHSSWLSPGFGHTPLHRGPATRVQTTHGTGKHHVLIRKKNKIAIQ